MAPVVPNPKRIRTFRSDGAFEAWPALAPTLMPLLRDEVAGLFLPWSTANAAAITRDDKSFETALAGASWFFTAAIFQAKGEADNNARKAA